MKVISATKISLKKLYLFILIGLLIIVPIILSCIVLITLIFPSFEAVNVALIVLSIIFGNYAFKLSINKSSSDIKIKLNNRMIAFNDEIILIENIEKIVLKEMFRYYPIMVFKLNHRRKISIRFSDSSNFSALESALKFNDKTCQLIRK